MNNSTSGSQLSAAEYTLMPALRYVIGVLFIVACPVGIFGNLIVLVAFLGHLLKKTVTNLLVFNLAITDFCVSLLPMPVYSVYYTLLWPEWTMGIALCKATLYIMRVCGSMSVITLVVIAVDRYVAIVKKKRLAGKRRMCCALAIFWCICALSMMYPLIGKGLEQRVLGGKVFNVCQKMDGEKIAEDLFFYTLLTQTVFSVFIVICLVITYASMIITVWKSRGIPAPDTSVQGKRHNVRALRFMFVILVAFMLTWVPYFVITFLRLFPPDPTHGINPSIVLLLYSLAITNSAWNPVLYALMSRTFRAAYKDILSFNFSKHSVKDNNVNKPIPMTQRHGTFTTHGSSPLLYHNGISPATGHPAAITLDANINGECESGFMDVPKSSSIRFIV